MLFSDCGKVVRFHEEQVRVMGRTAAGFVVYDWRRRKVVSLIVPTQADPVLTVTENGYGKRTALQVPKPKSRVQGVISIQVSDRNGRVVGISRQRKLSDHAYYQWWYSERAFTRLALLVVIQQVCV